MIANRLNKIVKNSLLIQNPNKFFQNNNSNSIFINSTSINHLKSNNNNNNNKNKNNFLSFSSSSILKSKNISNIIKEMEDVKMNEVKVVEPKELESTLETTNKISVDETQQKEQKENNETKEQSNIVTVIENSATILYNNQNEVFYNPVQEFNRDMSILMIKLFIEERKKECLERGKPFKKIRVLEALAATGLRSIRYAKEIGDDLDYILANDILQTAVDSIVKNREYNGVPEERIKPNLGDATMVMMENRTHSKQYDVVDVDPYGAPTQFLDSAVQAVADGGLLCVTATDTAVLCGSYPEACFHKYQSVPVHRAGFCHEMGLRILLHSIEQHANRYKRHIVPILSLSVDFYVRVFVRVYSSPLEAKKALSKMANIFSCIGCGSFHIQPTGVVKEEGNSIKYKVPLLNKEVGSHCQHCTKQYQFAGPFWAKRIHNVDFCKQAISFLEKNPTTFNTSRRMYGVLTSVIDELPDQMFYFKSDHFTHTLHLSTPPTAMIKSAILNGGYKVSSSHVLPSIKTDAPFQFLWDIFRTYAKDHPPKNLGPDSPAHHILSQEPKNKIDFTKNPLAKGEHPDVPKYFPNPKENWGPGSRATGGKSTKKRSSDEANVGENKKNRNQNKKKKNPTTTNCIYFIHNKCFKGDKCEYIHSKPTDSDQTTSTTTTDSIEPTTTTTTTTTTTADK
ncbi:hypothetical protein ACTFIR_010589 [Dictyostelium discoideum]